MDIRDTDDADAPALEALYRAAFPEEDLLELLRALTASDAISLAAEVEGKVVGNVAITRGHVGAGETLVGLIGPLAVTPSHQRQGIGGALLRAAFERLREEGARRAILLGDPSYYGRHGFATETGVMPPYTLPEEWVTAWQSVTLTDGPAPEGVLRLPDFWMVQRYWQA